MVKASLVVTVLSLFTSVFSFVSNLLVASVYGAGHDFDAYLIISSVPTFTAAAFVTLFSYSLTSKLIRLKGEPARRATFLRAMFFAIAALFAAFVAMGLALAHPIATLMSSADTTRGGLPGIVLSTWIAAGALSVLSFLGCVLSARDLFYAAAITSMFPYIGTLMVVAWFGAIGIVAVPLGSAIGATAGVVFLLAKATPELNEALKVQTSWADLVDYISESPRIFLAMSCFTSYVLIDAFWAPRLGTGSLASLGYAQRIVIAVSGIAVVGPFATVISHMAHAKNNSTEATARLLAAVGVTVAAATGLAAVVGALAEPVVALVLQRGAFDEAATRSVASILPVLLFGAVAMVASAVLIKGLVQLGLSRMALAVGIGWNVAYFSISGLLSSIFGMKGIAYSYALVWWAALGISLIVIARAHARLLKEWLTRSFVPPMVASCATALGVQLMGRYSPSMTLAGATKSYIDVPLICGVGIIIYASILYAVAQMFSIKDPLRSDAVG